MSQVPDVLFKKEFEVRWSDCDSNNHMRHSVYSELCVHARVSFMNQIGMVQWRDERGLSPVLFKEETEYFRELFMSEKVIVTVEPGEPTGSQKSVQFINKLYRESGDLCAVHKAVIGWIDKEKRKVVELPPMIREHMLNELAVP